ncbi:hypothetical protein SAMN05444339_10281 [Loktanella atrilutea]|uniref:Phage major tail tube protein n=1 Tax=Loktanella atrilutea TaxID=366533 RepID=A0A1M4WEK9_LOKAT|nr:phage major tail tube protein [Loktanella atrilutea]SHE79402.1 hypothetical protein SAMN05444339_10281 [Loktanella atrilutea]
MAKKLPAYVIKDVSLFAPGAPGSRIGQCSEITIPVLEKTMESFRNAGMIKPIEIAMGYETTECSFTETSFDPDMLKLFGIGAASSMVAYGYMADEDGTEHSCRFQMVGDVKKIDAGSWASGTKGEHSYDMTVHSGTLFIDDQEIIRFTPHRFWVGGVEQFPGRANALRL